MICTASASGYIEQSINRQTRYMQIHLDIIYSYWTAMLIKLYLFICYSTKCASTYLFQQC